MPKSPEQFYSQHQKDAERVEKAKNTYDKHLETAREAGDLTKHPELWDQASAEYQTEVKEKISEATQAEDYDRAEELIRGLKSHLATTEKYKEAKKEQYKPETAEENLEGSTVKESRQEILEMMDEGTWQHAKDKILGMVQQGDVDSWTLSSLAEMRTFDPERFDKELEISGMSWQRLKEMVEKERDFAPHFLLSAADLKKINPKLFEDQVFINDAEMQKIMSEVRECKSYPKRFLMLASAVKDLNPSWFDEYIGVSEEFHQDIWPRIKEEIESYRGYGELFAMLAGDAQNIKPEGEPDITVNKQEWGEIKSDLDDAKQHHAFRIFFSAANGASKLKVE